MHRIGYWLLMALVMVSWVSAAQEITFTSLIDEMTDRVRLASYPEVDWQCLQASSYNRDSVAPRGSAGWFADSDGTGFIREETTQGRHEWVVMEHEGPGCITRMWTPYFYYDLNNHRGPKIRIYLDGASEPALEAYFIELLTGGAFKNAPEKKNDFCVPNPFAVYTARAGDFYLPVPFGKHCKITLDQKPFYYVINYRAYPPNTQVATWSKARYAAVQDHVTAAAETLIKNEPSIAGFESVLAKTLAPNESATLTLPTGSRAVHSMEIQLTPQAYPQRLRSTLLRMTADDEETIWAPVGDFFCCPQTVNAFTTRERAVDAGGRMRCYWVMPYQTSASIEIQNRGPEPVTVHLRVQTNPWTWTASSMHFHACWRIDAPVPGTPFQDWNFIDIQGKGVYVGDAWAVLCADTGWWGEGDEKIYIDGDYDEAQFPRHFGTGSEDYYGWAGGEVPTGADAFSAPFLANVCIGNDANPRGYNICTRSRVLDAIPFHTRLCFDMEASFGVQMRNPWDLLHYAAMTYWYAVPGAKHNRPPQPEWAAKPAMTVEELDACQAALKR